jgi:hypothetical protein
MKWLMVAAVVAAGQQCGGVETAEPEPIVATSVEDADAGPVQEDPSPVQDPPPPVQSDAGTPDAGAETPPPPVDAGQPQKPAYAWGQPAGASCEASEECEDGDPRTSNLCESGQCVERPVADAPRAESACAADTNGWNYFVTAPPGPFQDEGLQPEKFSVPPGAHNANCEPRSYAATVATDFGREPGAECETASQCQGSDPCLQNACIPTGRVRQSDGKRMGICRVRVKQDGENRNWVFSDQWDVGQCQDGKATDAGKLHGPCLPDGTCTDGQCSRGREPWARFCQ